MFGFNRSLEKPEITKPMLEADLPTWRNTLEILKERFRENPEDLNLRFDIGVLERKIFEAERELEILANKPEKIV